MLRPLPPFRLRPLKKASVRKTVTADQIREATEEPPLSIKGARVSLKLASPLPGTRLKVLGRSLNSHA
jgi:hypothetical protein